MYIDVYIKPYLLTSMSWSHATYMRKNCLTSEMWRELSLSMIISKSGCQMHRIDSRTLPRSIPPREIYTFLSVVNEASNKRTATGWQFKLNSHKLNNFVRNHKKEKVGLVPIYTVFYSGAACKIKRVNHHNMFILPSNGPFPPPPDLMCVD